MVIKKGNIIYLLIFKVNFGVILVGIIIIDFLLEFIKYDGDV